MEAKCGETRIIDIDSSDDEYEGVDEEKTAEDAEDNMDERTYDTESQKGKSLASSEDTAQEDGEFIRGIGPITRSSIAKDDLGGAM